MMCRFYQLLALAGALVTFGSVREARADEPRMTPPAPPADEASGAAVPNEDDSAAPPSPTSAPPANTRSSSRDGRESGKTAAPLPSLEPPPPTPEEEALRRERRAAEEVSLAAYGATFSGERLVGAGSVGRYRLGAVQGALQVERFIGVPGFGLRLEGFFVGPQEEVNYVRAEAFGALRVARWEGPYPGGVAIFAGLGGDVGRYWFADDGRFFPLMAVKGRVWLTDDTPLQIRYTAMPVALATGDISLHEHAFEIKTGWKLLELGARMTFTFAHGGVNDRLFAQRELGGFVGLGVFE